VTGAPEDGLDVLRVVRRTFTEPARLAGDATNATRLEAYLTDMLRPYGLAPDPEALGRRAGQSYGELAEWAIANAVGPGEEVDLLVLAFAVPDITPGRATATYLSHVCPGNPLAFAICDQGRAAAFTGLRIIREYARTGGCRRALLIVVEQADLPYPTEPPVTLPAAHAVVALLLGSPAADGSRVAAVESRPDTSIDDARTVVARDLAGSTAILGAPLAGTVTGAVRVADDRQPSTGVWWELAAELDRTGSRRVVLADYDEQLRYLCTAAFDVHDRTATS
jgi:hypothetical protein